MGEIVTAAMETADTMLVVKMSVLSSIKKTPHLPILVPCFLSRLLKRALI